MRQYIHIFQGGYIDRTLQQFIVVCASDSRATAKKIIKERIVEDAKGGTKKQKEKRAKEIASKLERTALVTILGNKETRYVSSFPVKVL